MNLGRRLVFLAAPLLIMSALPMAMQAQQLTFDSSGNGMLNGAYYFREVLTLISDTAGDVSSANGGDDVALYGSIQFDGNGNYSMNATVYDAAVGQADPLSCYLADQLCAASGSAAVTGTYTVSSSGYGFIANPISQGDTIYGMVSKGIFIGSSTESGFNDLFIAGQVPSPTPSTATFNGTWTMDGYFAPVVDQIAGSASGVTYQISPNGAGSAGTVNITGYYGAYGSTVEPQTISGVTYSASSGAVVLSFPNTCNTTSLIYYCGGSQNPEYLYFSPDGNFIFGGAPYGFDMLIGVRNSSGGPSSIGNMYYTAGINHDFSSYASGTGFANLNSFYGSINTAGGSFLAVDRVQNLFNSTTYNAQYTDMYPPTSNYTDSATSFQYTWGDGGNVRIGFGTGPFLGLSVTLAATPANPSISPGGVFLDPEGIFSQATYVPFTSGIVTGEILYIQGSNLTSGSAIVENSGAPLQTTLNGTQVTINGTAAPLYYVAPNKIALQVPYANTTLTSGNIADIVVYNKNVASNTVSVFVNATLPGIFNAPGPPAVEHANGQVVTSSNPAVPGETVSAYVTGLGTTNPIVGDGQAAPYPPAYSLYWQENMLSGYIGPLSASDTATIQGAALSPTYVSLGQVNITIPSTTAAGNQAVQICGSDSCPDKTPVVPDYQRPPISVISVGAGSVSTSEAPVVSANSVKAHPRIRPSRKRVCLYGKCAVE